MEENRIDLSYFTLYLKKHLQDIGDSRADDSQFINERGDLASIEFEERRRNGLTVDQAMECAMALLVSELSES